MKTRTGFVSNSSSSSFVVTYRRRPESYSNKTNIPSKFLLTNKQVESLKKEGFEFSFTENPYFVGVKGETKITNLKEVEWYMPIYMTRSVICNQDDIIYVLFKNKIPFIALCHYDEELYQWDGKSKYCYKTTNNVNFVIKNNITEISPEIEEIYVKSWMDFYENWNKNTLNPG